MATINKGQDIKGNAIGPWKLGETLGLGSTGKVQLATNTQTNQEAAIKIISKAVFNSQSNNANSSLVTPDSLPYGIEREIIIMKLLNHPNVLRLYDVWETDSNLYMVLEYAEKGELFNLLVERGPLPEQEAVRFFRQIIIGISYCHALGIVHRDLKPENLLLDHKFNIKIADFGMAALETEDKLLETSCGSPHYAAPEIISGLPYHGLETDVWSCGIILFALLTGRLPFDEEDGNIRNLLLKVQSGHFEMPGDDEISHEAQDLIAKILTVDPKDRIKTREILKHPLLQKYPSIKDSKTIRNLPREDTYLNPLSDDNGDVKKVDKKILQNLVVLWHGCDPEDIVKKLKEPGANAEKTLYALLYRFKTDTEREMKRQSQLKKRQSMVKNSHSHSGSTTSTVSSTHSRNHSNHSHNSHHSRHMNVNTPTKRKSRSSMISVSSAHKRPVSFNRLSRADLHTTVTSSSNNTTMTAPYSNIDLTTTPQRSLTGTSGSSKRASINFSNNKRVSQLIANDINTSPTPAARSRRMSTVMNNTPPVPIDIMKNYESSTNVATGGTDMETTKEPLSKSLGTPSKTSRAQKRKSFKPNMQRGSITTKLISTYAQLAEDDDWEFIEKETRRVSSNFATLIDEIFEHEKYEQIRREKEELERKVREQKEREEKERREKEEKERLEREELKRKQEELQRQMEEEMNKFKEEIHKKNADVEEQTEESLDIVGELQTRSVSAPMEKIDNIIDNGDLDLFNRRNFSLRTRPVSRLDPGLMYSSAIGAAPYSAATTPEDVSSNDVSKKLDNEKVILETIRRSKFLGSTFDISRELEKAGTAERLKLQKEFEDANNSDEPEIIQERIVSTTNATYETVVLPKRPTKGRAIALNDEAVEPRKLSDIQVPQFTRKSKFFSESNKRFSVLSLYSAKNGNSVTNLADILKEEAKQEEVPNRSVTNKSQEPEFLFESPDGKDSYSHDSSSEDKIEDPSIGSKKPAAALKLSFHDRFTKEEKTKTQPPSATIDESKQNDFEPQNESTSVTKAEQQNHEALQSNVNIPKDHSEVKLPTLPPLRPKKRPNGLGIYSKNATQHSTIPDPSSTPKINRAYSSSIAAAVNVTPPNTNLLNESLEKLKETKDFGLPPAKSVSSKISDSGSDQNEPTPLYTDYKPKAPKKTHEKVEDNNATSSPTEPQNKSKNTSRMVSDGNPSSSIELPKTRNTSNSIDETKAEPEDGKKNVNSFLRKFSKNSNRQTSDSNRQASNNTVTSKKSLENEKPKTKKSSSTNTPAVAAPTRTAPAPPVAKSIAAQVAKNYDFHLKAGLPAQRMFKALDSLFKGWSKYGLKNVRSFPDSLKFSAKVANDNILSFKSTVFELDVVQDGEKACVLGFKRKSGSARSIKRLVTEVESVLKKENVLIK